jgi:hypothetical protein
VLKEETAAILPFRDAAMRRPIDLVEWMNSHASAPEPVIARDNVVQLTYVAKSSKRATRRFFRGGPSGGEAA